MPELRNLIVVPGHAPFRADVRGVPSDPSEDYLWALSDFQLGEPPAYIEHIKEGVAQLSDDLGQAMLVFSGGRTRLAGGPWSEAATYNAIASHYHYWEPADRRRTRMAGQIALEPFARDSLENLTHAIDTFVGSTSLRPEKITIVGWGFKEERFLFHARTLGLSRRFVRYIGVNDPVDIEKALLGEQQTLRLFREDPHALQEPLISKRAARNPFGIVRPSPLFRF